MIATTPRTSADHWFQANNTQITEAEPQNVLSSMAKFAE